MGIGALVGAGISAAGSLFGASTTSGAAKQAANAQVQSAQIAQQTQQNMFTQAKSALQPYLNVGNDGTYELDRTMIGDETGPTVPTAPSAPNIAVPTAPGAMTEADLESTPGYQFTLGQGLKATQNSAAERGLGVSGAALKGAATYATGLSDSTYNTRFQQQQQFANQESIFGNQQTNFGNQESIFGNQQSVYSDQAANQTNSFNRLYQTAGLGDQAAGALAGQSITAGNGIAQTQIGAGNAQAAGINNAAQATAAGITGTTGAFNNALSQYMYTGGGGLYGIGGGTQATAANFNPLMFNANGYQGAFSAI